MVADQRVTGCLTPSSEAADVQKLAPKHFEDLNVASAGGLFSASVGIPTWWRYAVNLPKYIIM